MGHVVGDSLRAIFVVGTAVLPILYWLLGKVSGDAQEGKQGAQARAKCASRNSEEKVTNVANEQGENLKRR